MTPSPNAIRTVNIRGRDIVNSLSLVGRELASTAAKTNVQALVEFADELCQQRRIFVVGAGRSGLVLRMAAMRLMHLGMTVHIAGDTTTPALATGDLLIAASGSGTTQGVVKAAETAQKVGARIIVLTANPSSRLAHLAHTVVVIPAAQKTDHGSEISSQYSGSLFEQVLFILTEALFQSLWDKVEEPAEKLWLRHANLE